MRNQRTQGSILFLITALLFWLVPASAAETCTENCAQLTIPGCTYSHCFDWGSGCYNCVMQCESQCEMWFCPDANPEWDCPPIET